MLNDFLQFVPPDSHREYLSLLSKIPEYVRRVAVVGEACPAIGHLLKKRPGMSVTGVTSRTKAVSMAKRLLDAAIRDEQGAAALPDGAFDALLLANLEIGCDEAMTWLPLLAPKLHAFGQVYVIHGAPSLVAGAGEEDVAALASRVADGLLGAGFHIYQQWPLGEPPVGSMAVAILGTYNPVQHAQSLAASGDFDAGFGILDSIPGVYLDDLAARENVWLLKLEMIAGRMEQCRGQDVSHLIGRMQDLHYALTNEFPRNPGSYQRAAQCWRLAGDDHMAQRVLDSFLFAVPDPEVARQRQEIATAPVIESLSVEAPVWNADRGLRVLFLIHPRPHFGLDALFDGLCTSLGDQNVVDFPWKPTLHGQESDTMRNYPCRFRRGGVAQSVEDVIAALHAGSFDAILYGDVEGELPEGDIGAILDARGACPVYLLDELDQPGNYRELARERLGLERFRAYFKREMLACVDYGPGAYPLPFAYTLPSQPPLPAGERSNDFFWAGHRLFGQRRLYLETLEARYGWDLDVRFDQDTYQQRVRHSRIGLNCFGMGFDTVRYWELPAHGCMLLSERLPIRAPYDFIDGVHAVFFDDLSDLVAKLDYYLAHPEAADAIAAAGYAHYRQHHTNEARARQMLGWMMLHQGI